MSLYTFSEEERSAVIDSVCTAMLLLQMDDADALEALQRALDELCNSYPERDPVNELVTMSRSLRKNGYYDA